MTEPILTLAGLERLLDTYGTDGARWPADAWDAAARLVATSDEARALWSEVAALDRMLGGLPPEPPSPQLVARVLADAPTPRVPARWRRAAAVVMPLAAAAGLALWLTPRSPLRARPAPLPTAVELTSLRLGEYGSPTDYLLDVGETAVASAVPSFGCDDSTLGCPTLDTDGAATTRDQT